VVPDVLDASTLDSARREMGAHPRRRAGGDHPHRHVRSRAGASAGRSRVRRVKTPHRFFPVFQQLLRHPRLVLVLRICSAGGATAQLQDQSQVAALRLAGGVAPGLAFYPHTNDGPARVGVMLDHCTSDNGPSWWCRGVIVIPSSTTTRMAISAGHRSHRHPATRSRGRCLDRSRAPELPSRAARAWIGPEHLEPPAARCSSTNTAPRTRAAHGVSDLADSTRAW